MTVSRLSPARGQKTQALRCGSTPFCVRSRCSGFPIMLGPLTPPPSHISGRDRPPSSLRRRNFPVSSPHTRQYGYIARHGNHAIGRRSRSPFIGTADPTMAPNPQAISKPFSQHLLIRTPRDSPAYIPPLHPHASCLHLYRQAGPELLGPQRFHERCNCRRGSIG